METRLDNAVRELVDALRDELTSTAQPSSGPERLLSVNDAAHALGIGRSMLYEELAAGRLRSVTIGRRRLIPSGALTAYTAQDAA